MPKPYQLDLRARVMAEVDAGLSLTQAAQRFGVAPSTASRWRKRLDEAGELEASPMGGRRALLEDHVLWFANLKQRRPHLTPTTAYAEVRALGLEVSYASVRRFMVKHGWAQARVRRKPVG